MPYRPLLELTATHPYPPAGALPGEAILPDTATAARLRGLRLLAKPVGDTLALFGAFDDDGALPIAPTDPLPLGFTIALPDAATIAATDLVGLAAAPLFTDARAGKGDPQRLRPIPDDRPTGPSAAIAVRLTPADLAAAGAGKPRRCVAALPGAAARWCYHIVTDMPDPLADWRVSRAAGSTGSAPVFGKARVAELTDAADDPVGAALVRRNPDLRILRFLSDAPFSVQAMPVRGLELRAGGTRLYAALPNPPPDAVARIGDAVVLARTLRIVTY